MDDDSFLSMSSPVDETPHQQKLRFESDICVNQ